MKAVKTQFFFHLFPTGTIAVWSIRREGGKKESLMKLCASVPFILIIPRPVSNIKTTWEMKNIFSSINEKKRKSFILKTHHYK